MNLLTYNNSITNQKSNLDASKVMILNNLCVYSNTLESEKIYLHYKPKAIGGNNHSDKIDVNFYQVGVVLIKNIISDDIFHSTFALLNDLNNLVYTKGLIIHGYVHPDFSSIFCTFSFVKYLHVNLAVFKPNDNKLQHRLFFRQENEDDNDVNAKYIIKKEYEPFFNDIVAHSTTIFDDTCVNSSMNEETKKIYGLKYKLVKDLQFTKSTKGLERFVNLEMLTIEHAIDLSWLTDISFLTNLKEITISNSYVNMDEFKFNKELLVISFICCEIKNKEYWRNLSMQNKHMDILVSE